MKAGRPLVSSLLVVMVMAGCASTEVKDRQTTNVGKIPRPNNILVSDFVATPADVPADSALAGHAAVQPTPQTAEQVATGRRVGAEIGTRLVEEIRGMGLPAARASSATRPQLNDLVIRGYLLSVDEGSAAKRVAIGFGSGASHLSVAVEGYQMTAQGLRKLGSGEIDAGGSKGPGAAAPLAVAVATGNPIGLIVTSGLKVYGEASGSSKVEGRADQVAKKIAEELRPRFRQQGWIQ
jgi:hypothetical protein